MNDAVARAKAITARVRAEESSLVDEIRAIDPGWGEFVNTLRNTFGGKFTAWAVRLDGRELRGVAPMREGTWVYLSPKTKAE